MVPPRISALTSTSTRWPPIAHSVESEEDWIWYYADETIVEEAHDLVNGQEPKAFQPVILVVDDEQDDLERVERELRKRYEADYRVVCEGSAEARPRKLRDLKAAGEDVALVLADQRMPGMSGVEFLACVRDIYPVAKRLLLIVPMDRGTGAILPQAMSLAWIN